MLIFPSLTKLSKSKMSTMKKNAKLELKLHLLKWASLSKKSARISRLQSQHSKARKEAFQIVTLLETHPSLVLK